MGLDAAWLEGKHRSGIEETALRRLQGHGGRAGRQVASAASSGPLATTEEEVIFDASSRPSSVRVASARARMELPKSATKRRPPPPAAGLPVVVVPDNRLSTPELQFLRGDIDTPITRGSSATSSRTRHTQAVSASLVCSCSGRTLIGHCSIFLLSFLFFCQTGSFFDSAFPRRGRVSIEEATALIRRFIGDNQWRLHDIFSRSAPDADYKMHTDQVCEPSCPEATSH